MIQRIQSVFLLLATGSMSLSAFFPFAHSKPAGELVFAKDGTFNLNDSIIFQVAIPLVILLIFGSIFLFRNRILQLRLTRISTGLIAGLAAGIGYYSFLAEPELPTPSLGLGFFAPLIALVLVVLASSFIKKDEKLVRDSDRLR